MTKYECGTKTFTEMSRWYSITFDTIPRDLAEDVFQNHFKLHETHPVSKPFAQGDLEFMVFSLVPIRFGKETTVARFDYKPETFELQISIRRDFPDERTKSKRKPEMSSAKKLAQYYFDLLTVQE